MVGDGVARKYDESLYHVAEFADVAVPAALLQLGDGGCIEGLGAPTLFGADELVEMVD